MARVIRHEFFNVGRSKEFRIVPLGDVHIGAAACDEKAFARTIKYIKDNDNVYYISMGDVAEFINVSDWRFAPDSLADWLTIDKLGDIAAAQRDRYLNFVEPIAHKCLGMIKGNHELFIAKKYERDIHLEVVSGVKERGRMKSDRKLSLGYYGWLRLNFYAKKSKHSSQSIVFNLHHGFVGGRLAGAKALNMQRWLWNHDCDIAIFGHSHNTSIQKEAVETLDRNDNIVTKVRRGCYSGTFLRTVNPNGGNTYSEVKGYFPLPIGGCEIILRPKACNPHDRIRIMS